MGKTKEVPTKMGLAKEMTPFRRRRSRTLQSGFMVGGYSMFTVLGMVKGDLSLCEGRVAQATYITNVPAKRMKPQKPKSGARKWNFGPCKRNAKSTQQ